MLWNGYKKRFVPVVTKGIKALFFFFSYLKLKRQKKPQLVILLRNQKADALYPEGSPVSGTYRHYKALCMSMFFVFSYRSFWPPLPLGRQLRGKAKLSLLLPVHPLTLLSHHLYLRLRHHPCHSEWVTLSAHAGSHATLPTVRDLRAQGFALQPVHF